MNIGLNVLTRFYWPLCRAYTRLILKNRPADPIMRFLCFLIFKRVHGYSPRFKRPRSFEEKIWSRMLFDRNPIWTMFSDRLRVRDYVASRAGPDCLVPLLWTGDKPEEIPFEKLPSKFVIKTNHGCEYNIFVQDKATLDQAKARQQLKKWLGENYCLDKFMGMEWGYKNIKPTIIIESFLDSQGNVPVDYKYFCYSGRAEFLKMDFDRFKDHSEAFFDKDQKPLDIFGVGMKHHGGKIEFPANYKDMVRAAESLSRGIDFLRVDLYSVAGRVYFGELTCYHGGGLIKLTPRKYDLLLGEKWKIARPEVAPP